MSENTLLDLDVYLKALEPFLGSLQEYLEEVNKYSKELSSLFLQISGSADDFAHTCAELVNKHEKIIKKFKKL